ncbi:MAG: hypothetical protein J4F36_09650 [Nitrosopumilaceae archaeon]|nr:hypothetical protein [Nitrosopumilaceae archaeon]
MKTSYKILISVFVIFGGLFLVPASISIGSTFYCNSIYPEECISYSISLFGGGGYGEEKEVQLQPLEAQFVDIKDSIEKTGYDICDIRLEGDIVVIDLHKFFEGSDPEKKILSQIPSYVNYEIVYHEGYSDYFIGTETAHGCDYLKCESPLVLINGECTYVTHPFDSSFNYTTNAKVDENNFPHVGEFVENEN